MIFGALKETIIEARLINGRIVYIRTYVYEPTKKAEDGEKQRYLMKFRKDLK